MGKIYKTELISHNTDTSYILKEAQAFDIILFNNKTWSLKTLFVKIGSNSGWNHAALVMDEPPLDLIMKNVNTCMNMLPAVSL